MRAYIYTQIDINLKLRLNYLFFKILFFKLVVLSNNKTEFSVYKSLVAFFSHLK